MLGWVTFILCRFDNLSRQMNLTVIDYKSSACFKSLQDDFNECKVTAQKLRIHFTWTWHEYETEQKHWHGPLSVMYYHRGCSNGGLSQDKKELKIEKPMFKWFLNFLQKSSWNIMTAVVSTFSWWPTTILRTSTEQNPLPSTVFVKTGLQETVPINLNMKNQ